MPLTDTTYFYRDLAIPNATKDEDGAALEQSIAQYEPEYLDKAFGPAFAEAFLQGLANPVGGEFSSEFSSEFDIGGIDRRWQWLRDGKVFTLRGGASLRWPGFRNVQKQSPAACYIYYWHRRINFTTTGQSLSEGIAKSENVTTASPARKMCDAWNKMVGWNRDLKVILYTALDQAGALLYPEYRAHDTDRDFYCFINPWNI